MNGRNKGSFSSFAGMFYGRHHSPHDEYAMNSNKNLVRYRLIKHCSCGTSCQERELRNDAFHCICHRQDVKHLWTYNNNNDKKMNSTGFQIERSTRTLSSAEVQAFVISIRCAKCTAGAKSNGSLSAVACNSVPALTLLSGSTPPENKPFEPVRRREVRESNHRKAWLVDLEFVQWQMTSSTKSKSSNFLLSSCGWN